MPKLKLFNKQDQQGFTLIELLVVVVVISALSGIVISLVNSGGFRDKARDSQRIADLKQIQTALELYFSDFRRYPTSNWTPINGSDPLSTALAPNYINRVPIDPENQDHQFPCNQPDRKRYNYRSNGNYYLLTSIMAVSSSNDGNECSSLNSWGAFGRCGSSFATQDFCYGVENP